MKICITLDDVLRGKTAQFGKIYKKYIDNDVDLDKIDISSGDLCKVFFNGDSKKYEKFLYEDYAFEIFSEAQPAEKMVDKNLILWHLDVAEDEDIDYDVELMLGNAREFNASIGYTYFFISKMATRIREVYLPKDSLELWEKCDIMVTADPYLLQNKPEGKVSVKIETDYNKDDDADYTYGSLQKFIDDKDNFKKIMTELHNQSNG